MPVKRRRMKGGARLLQLAKKSRIAAQDRRKKSAEKPAPGRAGNVTPLPKKSVVKKKVVGNSPRGSDSPSRRPVSVNVSPRVKKAVGSSSKKKITINPSMMPWYTPTTSTTPTKTKPTKPPTKATTETPTKPTKAKPTKALTETLTKALTKALTETPTKPRQSDPARKTSATERPYSQLLGNPFPDGVDPAESLKFAVNSMGGWSVVSKLPGVLGRIGNLLKKTPKKTPKTTPKKTVTKKTPKKTVKTTPKKTVTKKTVKREPDSHSIEGFVDEWVRKQDKMKSALRNKFMTGKHTKVEANRLRRALEKPRDLKTLRDDLRSRGVSDRKIDAVIRSL